MCGIAGVATETQSSNPSEGRAQEALRRLQHRGPDASGFREIAAGRIRCVLAAARLRIIDLTPLADQPLSNEDQTVWVAYNGEIYNYRELRRELQASGHRFTTDTDTEVLVHLYEEHSSRIEEMLKRLRGMFAFAVFDRRRDRLVLARDRLGVKPLYWLPVEVGVAFASEVRALAAIGGQEPRIDPDAVTDFLVWGTVQKPRTILAGAVELAPGSFIDWSGGEITPKQWWNVRLDPYEWNRDDARSLMSTALDDSVRRHLISDAPVGLFLSAGVDSRSIATRAADWQTHVRTLTVGFPEAGTDETQAAAEIASRVGSDHQTVSVTGAEVADQVERILTSMDQPTSDGVNTWIVSQAARSAGLKVVLSGVGGDELFQGYPSFRLLPRIQAVANLLTPFPRYLKATLAQALDERRPGAAAARVLTAPRGAFGAYRAIRSLFPAPIQDGRENGGAPSDSRDATTYYELTRYMSNQLLRDTDQMSMAHSLEARVPWLDDVVVDAALSLPVGLRTRSVIVGDGLASQPKVGFTLPFATWLRGPLRSFVEEALLSDQLPFAERIPAARRARIWDAFCEFKTHWSRPWAIAVLRTWPSANGFST